jgi:DNA repair protein RadA/Sms
MALIDDDNDDDEEDDDDEPPSVNVQDFRPPASVTSYGLFKGRSSPSTRKAMGTSGASQARIHICTNCGSEFVKHFGRCPTCKEWNTLQEHSVQRQPAAVSTRFPQPVFSSGSFPGSVSSSNRPYSWLDGTLDPSTFTSGTAASNAPIRITDLYDSDEGSGDSTGDPASRNRRLNRRIVVPEDDELNNVLGGGLVPGSLILLGCVQGNICKIDRKQ